MDTLTKGRQKEQGDYNTYSDEGAVTIEECPATKNQNKQNDGDSFDNHLRILNS